MARIALATAFAQSNDAIVRYDAYQAAALILRLRQDPAPQLRWLGVTHAQVGTCSPRLARELAKALVSSDSQLVRMIFATGAPHATGGVDSATRAPLPTRFHARYPGVSESGKAKIAGKLVDAGSARATQA